MEKRRDEDPFYEYSSIEEDSFSINNRSFEDSFLHEPLNENHLFSKSTISSYLVEKIGSMAGKESLCVEDHFQFKGHYKQIIKNHLGAKVIQELLSKASSSIIFEIFDELKFNLADYYKDTYSNYFMQKLYYYLNNISEDKSKSMQCKLEYLQILFKDIVDVSTNRVGTFAIQKLMDSLISEPEIQMVYKCLVNLSDQDLIKMAYVSFYNKYLRTKAQYMS